MLFIKGSSSTLIKYAHYETHNAFREKLKRISSESWGASVNLIAQPTLFNRDHGYQAVLKSQIGNIHYTC